MVYMLKGHEASELVFCPGLTADHYILGWRCGGDLGGGGDFLPRIFFLCLVFKQNNCLTT